MFLHFQQWSSIKNTVLKNFAILTGKHLCWSLFLTRLQAWKSATLLKRDSNTGVSCKFGEIIKDTCSEEHLQTTASAPTSWEAHTRDFVTCYSC